VIERGRATIVRTVEELRELTDAVRAGGGTVGFLGTSGNLHVGHLTLVRRMADECDLAVIPLTEHGVEPVPGLLEFPPGLPAMARDGAADRLLALEAGVDVVFMPDVARMYPRLPVQVRVVPDDDLAAPWPGAEDPVFVRMTATAVLKMLHVVGPCRYYAGEKDWVPLTVLRRMIEDLSVRVELVACPIVRDPDGVCASSRNARLSPEDRAVAPILYDALLEAVACIEAGERSAAQIQRLLRARIEPAAPLDYAEVVDASTLRPVDPLTGDLRVLVSADFSGVHLFDNLGVTA
jgi:pantoate--beta-alanine ligase